MTAGLELGDVYGATISRIKAQDGDKSRLGVSALMWISHAERPPRANELCQALAVQLGSMDFDVGNIPSMSTLVNCCQGLITVDKEASTVRLIHFTLKEYLSSHPDVFSKPHSALAEICLTYLNSQSIKGLSTDPSPDTPSASFLEYCSVYWGVHAKRDLSEYGRSLALKLLKEGYSRTSARLLLAQVKDFPYWRANNLLLFSGLHCASFFGIVEVVAGLIELECYNINEEDFLGRGPLVWAARNGHLAVVEILLGQREINPDKPDKGGRTPLSHAAGNGHSGVVKVLLGREEVDPGTLTDLGWTPLAIAAGNGHEEVVKLLVGRGEVDPNRAELLGRTPLWHSSSNGHQGVVEILLGREEVDPDRPDSLGRTPLSRAAEGGHEGVVKALLGREEVNPDKPDNYSLTPLSHAARNGHQRVLALLQSHKAGSPRTG